MSLRTFSRHWGCRVSDAFSYAGMPLVVLENEVVRVTVLPEKGAEIAELRYKPMDIDPLFHRSPVRPQAKYPAAIADPAGTFIDTYQGGWQEIFPSGGGPCLVKGAALGTHGEVFHLPWQWEIIEDRPEQVTVRFWVHTVRTPFYLERTMRLEAGKPAVFLEDKVTNLGAEAMPFMWGHHPAFGEPFLDGSCVLDAPVRRVEAHEGGPNPAQRLVPGSKGDWPVMTGADGNPVDLRGIPSREACTYDMFYLLDLQAGWAALTNRRLGLGIGLVWDESTFSALWVWQELRGSQGYPWYGVTYTLGLEPFSGYATTAGSGLEEVIRAGRERWLEPGARLEASLQALFYPAPEAQGVEEITRDGLVRLR